MQCCKIIAVLAIRNVNDSVSCMGQAHTSQSLKWKESQTKTSSRKWVRKTVRSKRFWREENLRGKMARARVYVNHVWRWGGVSRHQPMNWHNSISTSDNRHTWGCSHCVKLRSVEWPYERQLNIRMISEGSRDTEDWSNDAENSDLNHKNKLYVKKYSNRK